jgi:ribosomal protein S18 acetylase RimI-like enzyme
VKACYHLVPFDAKAAPPVRDLARLHADLLPASPVVMLGFTFMERFYYTVLPRQGLMFGAVAYVDDQPAGFVAATHDSAGFMQAAVRHRWPYLAWVIALSVLTEPRSIGAVWRAGRVMAARGPAQHSEPAGEILSLGVLSAYRASGFIKESGFHISNDLMNGVMDQLRSRGVRVVRAVVGADNTPTKLFYCGLGWTLKRVGVPGWSHPTVEFVRRT